MRSIRARLLAGLLALVAVTAICAGVITYTRVLAETSNLFDYQLRQMALSLRDEAAIGPGIDSAFAPGRLGLHHPDLETRAARSRMRPCPESSPAPFSATPT